MYYLKIVLTVESFIRKLNSNASAATDEQFKMRIHRSLLCLKCINHGLLETGTWTGGGACDLIELSEETEKS